MNSNNVGEYTYPKLQTIESLFLLAFKDKNIDFSRIVIVACQHILEPQKVMFERLINIGFLPKNIFLIGKIYSTNMDVLQEIKKLGICVQETGFNTVSSFDDQHKHLCKYILQQSKSFRDNAEKVVVLDDGGELIFQITQENTAQKIVAIEQTSSGFRKLEKAGIPFPVYNVARSKTKLELETPFIINLGVRRIEEKLHKLGWNAKNILVVGLGPIGLEMKDQLTSKGYNVSVYDKIHGEQNILEIIQKNIQVVIGTTGSQILSHDELVDLNVKLNSKILFVSMSSSDREFELWKLRDLFKKGESLHEDVVFGNIIITNNGFPITFKGNRFEGSASEMERTICLLFTGVCLSVLATHDKAGMIDIPETFTEKLS